MKAGGFDNKGHNSRWKYKDRLPASRPVKKTFVPEHDLFPSQVYCKLEQWETYKKLGGNRWFRHLLDAEKKRLDLLVLPTYDCCADNAAEEAKTTSPHHLT